MKDLSEVLSQLPAQPSSAPSRLAPSNALDDPAVEALLAQITQQSSLRRQLRDPLDPHLIFKFACLGLGALFAGVFALVAYWNRPVQSLAQAQVMQDMGVALVESQQQVKEAIAQANPPQYKCGARLVGDCHFPEQEQQPTQQPLSPSHNRPVQTLNVNHSPLGIGVPVMAAESPEVINAKRQLRAWETEGYEPNQTVEFIEILRQNPDSRFPLAEHLSVAHVRLYGARF